jgi:hypothetical protein
MLKLMKQLRESLPADGEVESRRGGRIGLKVTVGDLEGGKAVEQMGHFRADTEQGACREWGK